MTNEQIRSTIGELCGISPRVDYFIGPPDGQSGALFDESKSYLEEYLEEQKRKYPKGIHRDYVIHKRLTYPNYPEDLNACREFEDSLDDVQIDYYKHHLNCLITHPKERITACATAITRCQAFLRLKGKRID